MRQFVWVVFAAIWFLAIILWPRNINRPSSSEGGTPNEGLYKSSLTKANFGLLGTDFFETANGRKQWNIRSDFAELHRKESYCFMKVVNADFYASETGNKVSTISDFGRSWLETREVHLEGNVKIHSERGYQFTMKHLNYQGAKHEFVTDDPVEMIGPDIKEPRMILNGVGLLAHINSEHFKLQRKVRAKRRLSSDDWLHITSRKGEFFTDKNRAKFEGNVISKMPDMEIRSTHFEITVNDGKESLLAKKDVTLQQRDRKGSADEAVIQVGGNEIVLLGNARIDSKGNIIEGNKIVLHTTDDQIEVEGAKGSIIQ